jgi:hypothetical protein
MTFKAGPAEKEVSGRDQIASGIALATLFLSRLNWWAEMPLELSIQGVLNLEDKEMVKTEL